MGKEKSSFSKRQRHDPLHKQILSDSVASTKKRSGGASAAGTQQADEEFVNSKLSKRILDIAQDQQREIEAEEGAVGHGAKAGAKKGGAAAAAKASGTVFGSAAFEPDSEDDQGQYDDDEWDGGNDDILDVDANELQLLETFFPAQPATRQSLADIIAEKIAAFEADAEARAARGDDPSAPSAAAGGASSSDLGTYLNPKIIQVYTKVGKLLSRYKSGKLPKAFKLIPSMPQWEDILYLTRPDTWTPHATFEATKIFVSNLSPQMAQRFMNVFLLEKVREEIQTTKKLSYHMYRALKKALYKPAAFFKGVLLPLVDSGCSLREAAIVGSVVSKVSVPILHSAACMMKLADMEYSGSASLFLRILLDKKYALPWKVVDSIVFHFLRFRQDSETRLPVLWHQALLVFAQRYKESMTDDQKLALLELIKVQIHESITPEIRRELANSRSRAAMAEQQLQQQQQQVVHLAGLSGMDVEMVDV